MKKTIFFTRSVFVFAAVQIIFFAGCGKKTSFTENTADDIQSINYEGLKRLEPITIVFREPLKYPEHINTALKLTPQVKGKWELKDSHRITFTPSQPYDFKKELTLNADTGLLQENIGKKRGLTKTFSIFPPEFSLIEPALIPDEKNGNVLHFEAVGETDIPLEREAVKKIVTAAIENKTLPVQITEGKSPNRYNISIQNIQRGRGTQNLAVKWNLSSQGFEKNSSESFIVAAASNFQIVAFKRQGDNVIDIHFSDMLDTSQDLRGFVKVLSKTPAEFRHTVNGHVLKLFCKSGAWQNDTAVRIFKGIKDASGKVLRDDAEFKLTAAWDKPAVSFTASGAIVPSKENASILVSTKNIKGLMLEVFHIYDNNMLQFLQVNTLNGSYQLNRVGEPVWRQTFDFEWDASMKNKSVVRKLDLKELVKKFPGGMFELRVGFVKKHSMYRFDSEIRTDIPFPKDFSELEGFTDMEKEYWERAEAQGIERYGYWEHKNNPQHPAYYLPSFNKSCFAAKQILVSNIGLSVKKDRTDKLYIAAADIVSGKPISGAEITLFSYAQKTLKTGKTDSQGLLMLENAEKAAFVQAEKDGLFNWIRLEEAPLSVSHFNVEGERSERGIKGYIYGERGVWRPGDAIHLVFILQDTEKSLPEDFPVRFSLEGPLGRKTDYKVFTSSVDGFYRIDTGTDASAKTGTWTARVTAGGKTWNKPLKIETIVPNRLFVNLETKEPYLNRGENRLLLNGEWLHGASAAGLKAQLAARFTVDNTPFEKYKNYRFINPELKVRTEQNELWEGILGNDGSKEITLDLDAGAAPGKLRALFESRIYEPSGAFSTENRVFQYSPYKRYIGMAVPESDDAYRQMLYTNRTQTLNFLVLDPGGNRVKEDVPITVKLYKLEWFWWWETDYQSTNYTSSRSTQFIRSWDISAKNGAAELKMTIEDGEWGRYLIAAYDEKGGHSTAQVVYFDWEGWASRRTDDETSASMLSVAAGKLKYYTDETAEITFPCSDGARALITVEKNGKILKQEWVNTVGTICSYKLQLAPFMAPNIYVHVSLIQEHMQTKNSLPIRMYGITPVMIENKNTHLKPLITADAYFEPDSKARFTVTEEKGTPMTFTVAVVDEGLLGLTAFSAADPWKAFNKKESSQLDSWDVYNHVIGAYGGTIESLLAVGGSEDIKKKGGKNAERFKPVVFFFGPYEIKKGEKKHIEFEMPQYVGAVRIMAIAGKNGAYGVAEKSVKVKSDLMVLPTLPRTLGVDETVQIPVTVFNGTASEKTATVSLKADGSIKTAMQKKISVKANGDASTVFEIKTDKQGIAQFNIEASSGGKTKTAKSFTEIAVLSRGLPYSTTETVSLSPGQKQTTVIHLKGENSAKNLTAEISQLPPLGLESRIGYLLRYPYGCIEQITSAAFPQIYLPDMTQLDIDDTEKTKKHIKSVLDRYPNYQTSSGGFAYWQGGQSENSWGTNYAGHFMTEAKKAGYEVSGSVYQAWLSYQSEKAKAWAEDYFDSAEDQSYRLYTLAIAGKPEIGAMNRLKTRENSLSTAAKSLLANAYALSGHGKTAIDLLEKTDTPEARYRSTGGHFSSNLRDTALLLNAYTICNILEKSPKLIQKLATASASGEWLSTQETAWILLSLAPYYRFNKNNKTEYEIRTETNTIKDKLSSSSRAYKIPVFKETEKKIEVHNLGQTPLYAALTVQGRLLPGEEESLAHNLALHVTYINSEGRIVTPEKLSLGEKFRIIINIENKTGEHVENIALSLPIPTGWEMTNLRLTQTDDEENESTEEDFTYQDFTDTHIFTFFDLEPSYKQKGGEKTFRFTGTVTYGGSYYLPAVSAEAMYDNEYKAVIKGQKLTAKSEQLK